MSNFQIMEIDLNLNNLKIQLLDFIVVFDKLDEFDKHLVIENVNIISGFKIYNLYESLENYIERSKK